MANLTPEKIQELADPVESIYQDVVDELLINIGKHLRGNTTTWTAYWEVQKLAELGQLTAENAAIINRYVENMPQTLKDTMEATRKVALSGIESQLQAAAAKGYLTPPIMDSSVAVYKNLMNQAADRLNATNTTMLESSVNAYQQAVHMTAQRADELERSGEYVMEQSSAALASGTVTRTQALKETIQKLSDTGLTGFYDRAGRSWSPEAYVNMVTRTTVHNVSIEATKARMQDYGTSVIQISSHAGARPLCYPYQGKFYSWDGSSGDIELGNGRTVHYEALSSTSYGQPAGIFGINCGHYPIPVIPGVTIPHGADNIEPEEENNKNYAESQQQRALERKVREAKRVLEMEGDLATDKQKQALKEAQAASAKFAAETGRTRRYDREQIYSARPPTKKAQTLTTGPSEVIGASGNKLYKGRNSGNASTVIAGAENIAENSTIRLENSTQNGILDKTVASAERKVESDIYKQKTSSLRKGIISHEDNIALHKDKIKYPEKHDSGWDLKTEQQKNGLLKHWENEINTSKEAIKRRQEELKRRGENTGE